LWRNTTDAIAETSKKHFNITAKNAVASSDLKTLPMSLDIKLHTNSVNSSNATKSTLKPYQQVDSLSAA